MSTGTAAALSHSHPFGTDSEWLSTGRTNQLVWAFLLLGLLARVLRYVLCFPLWEDECFLCYNFIDRGYADLLRPLDYQQVAPVLFLWTQLTATKLFGYSEYSLRLFPLLCSVGSLFLFRHMAQQILRGVPLVFSMAVFAVAYPCIRYSAEAKPYGSDLFVSLVLLTLAVHWWRRPGEGRWLAILTLLVPLAIGLSYPAVFTAGGISLFMAWTLWQQRTEVGSSSRHWMVWAGYNLALLAAFATCYLVCIRPQHASTGGFMVDCWQHAFPPLHSPFELMGWLWSTHTGDMLRYPIGGNHGASALTFLFCLAAVVLLIRRKRFELTVLLLGPLAVNFIAAALHRYPYGSHMRFTVYWAAGFCLLTGIGAGWLAGWLRHRRAALATGFVYLALLCDLGIAAGTMVRDVAQPYKTQSDEQFRGFAHWFWNNSPYNGEAVCVHRDLKEQFLDRPGSQLTWKAMYLCNQQIYSPRHRRQESPRWDRISPDWPLRCVHYYDSGLEGYNRDAYRQWLREMQNQYELVSEEELPMTRFSKGNRRLVRIDYVYVLKFIPRERRVSEVAEHRRRFPPLRR